MLFTAIVSLITGVALLARPRFWSMRAVRQIRKSETEQGTGLLYRVWFAVTILLGLLALALAAWIGATEI